MLSDAIGIACSNRYSAAKPLTNDVSPAKIKRLVERLSAFLVQLHATCRLLSDAIGIACNNRYSAAKPLTNDVSLPKKAFS